MKNANTFWEGVFLPTFYLTYFLLIYIIVIDYIHTLIIETRIELRERKIDLWVVQDLQKKGSG